MDFFRFKLFDEEFDTFDKAVQYYCEHYAFSDCNKCSLNKEVRTTTKEGKEVITSLCGYAGIKEYPELICINTGIKKQYKPIKKWTIEDIIEWYNQNTCEKITCKNCPLGAICGIALNDWEKNISDSNITG